MKKIKFIVLIIIAVLLLVSPCVGTELGAEWALYKETLRGHKEMRVVVDMSQDAVSVGLTKSRIRVVAELRLRMAGITVIPYELPLDKSVKDTKPYLYIAINMIKTPPIYDMHLCIYHTRVQFYQLVFLGTRPKIASIANTWFAGSLNVAEAKETNKAVCNIVRSAVDKFINDYLAVNPIQPSTPKKK